MAAIDDLIAQVDDAALRARLKEEADRLRRDKKVGLVFEEHLPELTPVYSAPLRAGCLAAPRGAALTAVWRVLQVKEGRRTVCTAPAASRPISTRQSWSWCSSLAIPSSRR